MSALPPDDARRNVQEARSEDRVPGLRRVDLSGMTLSDLGVVAKDPSSDLGLTSIDPSSDLGLARANLRDANLRVVDLSSDNHTT